MYTSIAIAIQSHCLTTTTPQQLLIATMGNSISKPAAIGLGIAASLAVPGECRKRNGSTKSSKDPDNVYCSTDTLTRSNVVTNLLLANVADDNNEINQASIEEFCNAGPNSNKTAAFLYAVENSAGSLVDAQCTVQAMFAHVYSGEAMTVTEGELQVGTINTLCYAEQSGDVMEDCDYRDPCAVINGDDGIPWEVGFGNCSNNPDNCGWNCPIM